MDRHIGGCRLRLVVRVMSLAWQTVPQLNEYALKSRAPHYEAQTYPCPKG
jgi:hypothetical protein